MISRYQVVVGQPRRMLFALMMLITLDIFIVCLQHFSDASFGATNMFRGALVREAKSVKL